jgi:hypothetical protein
MGSVISPETDRRSPGAGTGAATTAEAASNPAIARKIKIFGKETILLRIFNPL